MASRVSRIYWSGLLLLTLCFLSSASGGGGAATAATMRRRRLETSRLLKKLNKPAVKSIKSPDGDIIDCVHISQQPAFDHPLLRNHTIQMRPSFHPKSQFYEINLSSKFSNSSHHKQSSKQTSQLWHKNGRCPKNTIPIRRTKEEDVLRANSVESYGRKKQRSVPFPLSSNPDKRKIDSREYAIISVSGDKYYGAMATMNVWNPYIEQSDEFTLSQLWIGDGSYDNNDLNCIEAGWQDPLSGNWWMQFDGIDVGYWPSNLFTHLNHSASLINWGGEVLNKEKNGHHTSTGMGSGHFAEEGHKKASYLKNIQIVDSSNTLSFPQEISNTTTHPSCYNLYNDHKENSPDKIFYYGGPGENSNCP